MKFTARILLLASLSATFAVATCNQAGKFCHIIIVIIVIQENRTPDNLFGANLTFENASTSPAVATASSQSVSPCKSPASTSRTPRGT
jgi:phospholipase C